MSRFNTGNPLGSGDSRDLDDNAKNMDLAVNSDGDTFQDRLGKSRLTWAGIVKAGSGDPAIAVDAAARAVAAAQSVEEDAERIVQDVVAGVDGAVQQAVGAADRAEAASDAAFVNAKVYPTVSGGRYNSADGEQYQVLSTDGLEYIRYVRESAEVSTEVARYPAAALARAGQLGRAMLVVSPDFMTFERTSAQIVTVGWSSQRVFAGYSSLRRIADQPPRQLSAGRGLYIDLDTDPGAAGEFQVLEAATNDIAFDITNRRKLLLVHNQFGILMGELAPALVNRQVLDAVAADQGDGEGSGDSVYVRKLADRVHIYMKGENSDPDHFLHYQMVHRVVPETNCDVWHWEQVFDVVKTGDFAFTTGRRVATFGENENAIMQEGKADFMGGYAHGDEELFEVTCLVDGIPSTLGSIENIKCQRIEFLQGSNFFEEGTNKSTIVGKSYKRWQFERGEVRVSNHIEWLAPIVLKQTYLAMLSILRSDESGPITDVAYRSPKYLPENIASAGFPMVYSDSNVVKLAGPDYSVEMEILRGWDKPGRKLNISNSAAYNKIYFDFTGEGYQVEVGEVFESEARWRIG